MLFRSGCTLSGCRSRSQVSSDARDGSISFHKYRWPSKISKAIPKIGSRKKVPISLRRNARFSLRKSARRITKGVIHVKASFNNTEIKESLREDSQGKGNITLLRNKLV